MVFYLNVVILNVSMSTEGTAAHCKKGKVVLTQFVYLSFIVIVCIVKHSGVPLSALDSTQINNLI